ncbi:MAG: DUF423 domain-containing protein [Rhodanobacteraceae bacterium]|jgi:uncharacterized membrane protein YgdD (TMEM256/DUF423 family)|nr:MAG: DUF423 domain-containing protein [Rhodanobacteraceae bacterium]
MTMGSDFAATGKPLRWPAVATAIAGASAVLLGALGAHALRTELPASMLEVWETAVRFQFWHALALAVCAVSARRSHARQLASVLFTLGIVLFCGSLYALALGAPRSVGIVTPLGGIALVAGWIALGVMLYQRKQA